MIASGIELAGEAPPAEAPAAEAPTTTNDQARAVDLQEWLNGDQVADAAGKWTHYLVLDFEATCDRNDPTQKSSSEVIEWPCVLLDSW